jgi:hypothetical protein
MEVEQRKDELAHVLAANERADTHDVVPELLLQLPVSATAKQPNNQTYNHTSSESGVWHWTTTRRQEELRAS